MSRPERNPAHHRRAWPDSSEPARTLNRIAVSRSGVVEARASPRRSPSRSGAIEFAPQRMPKHRVGLQHFEDFAGHGAREAGERPAVEQRPFGVGAGHDDEAGKTRAKRESPSSWVSSPRITSSAPARAGRRRGGCGRRSRAFRARRHRRRGAEIGRRVEIGRLKPALARASHAADHAGLPVGRVLASQVIERPAADMIGRAHLAHAAIGLAREKHRLAVRRRCPMRADCEVPQSTATQDPVRSRRSSSRRTLPRGADARREPLRAS